MDNIELNCGNCNKKLKVPIELSGRKVKCNGCNSVIIIPETESMDLDQESSSLLSKTNIIICSFILLTLAICGCVYLVIHLKKMNLFEYYDNSYAKAQQEFDNQEYDIAKSSFKKIMSMIDEDGRDYEYLNKIHSDCKLQISEIDRKVFNDTYYAKIKNEFQKGENLLQANDIQQSQAIYQEIIIFLRKYNKQKDNDYSEIYNIVSDRLKLIGLYNSAMAIIGAYNTTERSVVNKQYDQFKTDLDNLKYKSKEINEALFSQATKLIEQANSYYDQKDAIEKARKLAEQKRKEEIAEAEKLKRIEEDRKRNTSVVICPDCYGTGNKNPRDYTAEDKYYISSISSMNIGSDTLTTITIPCPKCKGKGKFLKVYGKLYYYDE